MTQVGEKAPDFTLPRDGGDSVTLSALRPAIVVLYFYPKDDTSGCTKQAIGFTEHLQAFKDAGCEIIGVSKDTAAKHDKFRDKFELNYPLVSDTDHAIALEPMLADRIEILRGPASLRYGPGAIGGVVNIIDNRIHSDSQAHVEGAIETRYGSNNDNNVVVGRVDGGSVQGFMGDAASLNLHLSGLVRQNNNMEIPGLAAQDQSADETTNGYVANTDAKASAWNLGISRVTDNMVIGIGMSRVDNNYGVPPGGHAHHEDHEDHEDHEEDSEPHGHTEHHDLFTRIDMRQTEYSGKLLLRELPGVFDTLDINLTHSDYRHNELEIDDAITETGSRYATKESQLRAELTYQIGDWLGATGFQAKDKKFTADGDETFVPPNDIEALGLFVTEETRLGNGTLELGIRLDHQTADPDSGNYRETSHSLFNASASYLYPLTNSQQISLIYTHSQRAPTAEELFSQGEHAATNTYVVGNIDMDKEAANSVELTWGLEGPIHINAALYHREFTDFIYEATNGTRFSHDLEDDGLSGSLLCTNDFTAFDNDPEIFENALPCYFYQQEGARFSGVELEVMTPITDNSSIRVWGDVVRAKLDGGGDVPRIPPARLGADVDVAKGNWIAGIGVTHGFKQNNPGANESNTAAYTRIDAHISFNIENWSLFLKGSNLSDEEIRNAAPKVMQGA